MAQRSFLLGHPVGHRDVEVRTLHRDIAHARGRHVDLGAGDEPRVGLEVVEVAAHVGHARDAPADLGRDGPQGVDARQRHALEHHVGRERPSAPQGRRPEHRAGGAGARPGRGPDLLEDERADVQVGPGDALLPVVPAHRGVGVALREALAVQRDVPQVALRADGDESAPARVLGAAERHVHVRARGHRRVEPVEAGVLVEREHGEHVAHPEPGALPDRVDDEAPRAAEVQLGGRNLVGALPPFGAHGR